MVIIVIDVWDITIPELTGQENRKLYISLPNSYNEKPDEYYPVLYMFDGQNVFFDSDATYGKSWGLKEYLEYTNTQMIVVAPACNQNPDNGRLKEYTPYPFKDKTFGNIKSLGKITMEWFVNELKPTIDNTFRTLSDRNNTFIAGSSMGGLMSLYAILEYNHIFSRAAALSPSIWTGPQKLAKMIKNANINPDTVVYMDYGTEELPRYKHMIQKFAMISSMLMKKNIRLNARIVPNGTHSEASWEKQIPFFVETLLYEK